MEASFSGEFSGYVVPQQAVGSMVASSVSDAKRANDETPAPESSDQPTFREILHALNPLQHLPVVGTIYRAITGDTIRPAFRVAGSVVTSLLMGGPIGVIGTALGCLAEEMWNRGLNQPGGMMPLTYSAGAEAAIPAQLAMLPQAPSGSSGFARSSDQSLVAASTPVDQPAAMPPLASDVRPTFDTSGSPELARRVGIALAAYGRNTGGTSSSAWSMSTNWLPTVAG